jgi:probable HAF family extracellular repeat protein
MRTTFVSALFLFSLLPALGESQVYTVKDLGPLSPVAINTWGEVAGNLNGHAYLWTKFAGLKDLGVLSGGTISSAISINDLGEVVGDGDLPPAACDGSTITQTVPFLWTRKGGMKNLGTVGAGRYPACVFNGYASGINDLGQVSVTNGQPSTTYIDAYEWTQAGGLQILPGTTYQGKANGINNKGQIVGATGSLTAFFPPILPFPPEDAEAATALWENGMYTALPPLTSNGQSCSEGTDINDFGQVVGWSNTTPVDCFRPESLHAFLWTIAGGTEDLGVLPGETTSTANKINWFGQVIGLSGSRPFLWTKDKGMKDLNDLIARHSGWTLNTATGINVWGQIVGQGTLKGQPHGFLLTPRDLEDSLEKFIPDEDHRHNIDKFMLRDWR